MEEFLQHGYFADEANKMRKCADSEARARAREKRLTLKRRKKTYRTCNRNIFHEYNARTIKKRLFTLECFSFLRGFLKDNAIKKVVQRFRRDVYASENL